MTGRTDSGSVPTFSVRHLLTQAGWGGAMELAGLGLRFGLAILIARLAGPAGLGVYVLGVALARGASLIGRLGMDRTLLRFMAFHRGRHERAAAAGIGRYAVGVTLGLSTAFGIGLFVLAPALASAFSEPPLEPALRLLAVAVPLIALGEVWGDGLRAFEDVRLAAFAEKIFVPAASAVLLVGISVAGRFQPLSAIATAVLAYGGAAALVGAAFWRRARRDGLTAPPREYRSRAWLRFAIFISGEGLLIYLLTFADQLMVGFFLGAADVGLYAAAVRLAGLVALPLLAVNPILTPTVARLHGQGATGQLRDVYVRMAWLTAGSGAALALAIGVAGPFLLSLFGANFQAAYPALVVLLIGQLINTCTGSAGVVLGMTGHVGWRLINAALTAVLLVTLGSLLIPVWGIVGAAAATSMSIAAINVLQVVEVRYVLGYWPYESSGLAYWMKRLRHSPRIEQAPRSTSD